MLKPPNGGVSFCSGNAPTCAATGSLRQRARLVSDFGSIREVPSPAGADHRVRDPAGGRAKDRFRAQGIAGFESRSVGHDVHALYASHRFRRL
jgi:hypothetical protein